MRLREMTTQTVYADAEFRRAMARTLEPRPTIPPPLSARDHIHTALFAVAWIAAMIMGFCVGEWLRG